MNTPVPPPRADCIAESCDGQTKLHGSGHTTELRLWTIGNPDNNRALVLCKACYRRTAHTDKWDTLPLFQDHHGNLIRTSQPEQTSIGWFARFM